MNVMPHFTRWPLLLFLAVVPWPRATARTPGFLPAPATAASGVNISGLEIGGTLPGGLWTDYAMPTTYEIAYYASRGMTIARIPFSWERMQPTLGGPLNTTYLGYVQQAANMLRAVNARALLDLHNYGQ